MHSILVALILALGLTLSHVLLKYVSSSGSKHFLDQLTENWMVIAFALAIYGAIFFYYLYALRVHSLSILYPVYVGLSMVFVALVGRLYFEEMLHTRQFIGVALIGLGVVLIGWADSSA